MLRIGLAGAGGLGKVHLNNYLNYPGVAVVALADVDADRRRGELSGVQFNIEQAGNQVDFKPTRSYADYRDLCADEDLDVVSICLPSDLHCDAAVRALEAGKSVFCEKPIALTVEQGRRMLDAAASGKTLMIGHCLRFWPEYLAVENVLRSGRFGRVLAAGFTRVCSVPNWGAPDNWFAKPHRSGGPVIDLHIHDADLCIWWWGKPAEISAAGTYMDDIPGILHSRWRYDNGPAVQFESGWEAVQGSLFYFNFKLTFERATLMYDSRNDKGLQLLTAAGEQRVPVEPVSAYEAQDRYFLDCVSSGRPVDRCPPEDSLVALECVTEEARQLADACGRQVSTVPKGL